MASSNENVSMALFCDFENVALGVRDANYDKFDIKPVLERLLLKGSIVVKKAYCDWDRYKSFKASMHEANFELIEIPHVRQSGKNSADIRMVVDALDLCYTKSHVDTFVIISGDSDFSPLVSKLRENAKKVIGVGVKQSTSDLLVANCDEFIFYDDLVRESRRARRDATEAKQPVKRSAEEERARREEMDKRRNQAVEIAVNTFEALVLERGDSGKIWASVLKEAIKRRKPDFSESYYGFRTFGNLIEECKARGLLEFGRDEKSGAYVYRGNGVPGAAVAASAEGAETAGSTDDGQDNGRAESRRSRNRGRTAAERFAERQAERQARQPRPAPEGGEPAASDSDADVEAIVPQAAAPESVSPAAPEVLSELADVTAAVAPAGRERGRGNRGGRHRGERQEQPAVAVQAPPTLATPEAPVVLEAAVDVPEASPAVSEPAAPVKKKNGTKPPARKLKAAAKAPVETSVMDAGAQSVPEQGVGKEQGVNGKAGKGGKGRRAAPAQPATATAAASAPSVPVTSTVPAAAVEPVAADAAPVPSEQPKQAKPKAKPRAKPAARAPKAAAAAEE